MWIHILEANSYFGTPIRAYQHGSVILEREFVFWDPKFGLTDMDPYFWSRELRPGFMFRDSNSFLATWIPHFQTCVFFDPNSCSQTQIRIYGSQFVFWDSNFCITTYVFFSRTRVSRPRLLFWYANSSSSTQIPDFWEIRVLDVGSCFETWSICNPGVVSRIRVSRPKFLFWDAISSCGTRIPDFWREFGGWFMFRDMTQIRVCSHEFWSYDTESCFQTRIPEIGRGFGGGFVFWRLISILGPQFGRIILGPQFGLGRVHQNPRAEGGSLAKLVSLLRGMK